MVDLLATTVKSTEVQVEITSWTTGVLVFLVVMWALFGPKLGRFHLTEGSAACLFGLLCGGLLLMGRHYIQQQAVVQRLLAFSAASFFTYLLPPVIFYAGLSIEKTLFFSNLGSILALGVVGTTVSALVLAGLLAAGFAGLKLLRIQDCIALGAIFSATDSVATLQVLNPEKQPVLFSLVFGEGVINDATSVVLLGAVSSMFPTGAAAADGTTAPTSGWETLGGIATTFLYLFATSLALGISTGMAISCLVVRFAAHGPHHEVALIGLLSYLSYLAAEVLGLSGILSLFCCGLTVSQFALDSISAVGRTTTLNAFHTMSYICEGIIFIYLGMDALDPAKWHGAHTGEAISLCGALLLLLVIARAVSVLPILGLHNWFHPAKLGTTDMVIICWSGLMRGAVSVALAYFYFDIGSPSGSTGDRHHSTLIVATLVVVMTSVLLLGAATQPLMQLLVEDPDMPLLDKLGRGARGIGGKLRFCGLQLQGAASCCMAVARRTGSKRQSDEDGSTNGRGWFSGIRGLSRGGFQPLRTTPDDGHGSVDGDEAGTGNGRSPTHRRPGVGAAKEGGGGDMELGSVVVFGGSAASAPGLAVAHPDVSSGKDEGGRESSAPVTPREGVAAGADRAGLIAGSRGGVRGDVGRRLRGGTVSDADSATVVHGSPLATVPSKDHGGHVEHVMRRPSMAIAEASRSVLQSVLSHDGMGVPGEEVGHTLRVGVKGPGRGPGRPGSASSGLRQGKEGKD